MSFSPNAMLQSLDKALEEDNVVNGYLDKLEKKTSIKKRYFVIGLGTFFSIYLVYGYAADLLCNVIGFVYPAYISVKAIESASKDDDTEWLIYWVVFATFSVVEFFSDILLSWFPFYFLGKCIFLLWCMSSGSWNGSKVIYWKFIRPLVLKNEIKIDNALNMVNMGAKDMISSAASGAAKVASSPEVVSKVAASMLATSQATEEPVEEEEPTFQEEPALPEEPAESTLTYRRDAGDANDGEGEDSDEDPPPVETLSRKDE